MAKHTNFKRVRSAIELKTTPQQSNHKDILSWPITRLDVPSLIENTLTQLHVHTLDDLLRLDMDDVSNMRGVGVSKVKAISALKTLALRLLEGDATPSKEKTYILDELIAAGIDPDMPWSSILTRLDKRSRTVFEREGFESLRDIVLRYESNTLMQLAGFGENSYQRLGEQLDDLIRLGLEEFRYGEDGRPDHVLMALDRCLDGLSTVDRDILFRRYDDGDTLEAIANDFEMSREGIRQRLERALLAMKQQYRAVLQTLCDDFFKEVERRGGLIPLSNVWPLMGCEDVGSNAQLRLLLDLLEQPHTLFETCLCMMSEASFERFNLHMMQLVEESEAHLIDIVQLVEHANAHHIKIEPEPLLGLLCQLWDAEAQASSLVNPWLDKPTQYAAMLRDHGQAIHLDDMRTLIAQTLNSDQPPSERHVYLYLQRAEDVYYVDRGMYLHQDHLPVGIEQLQQAAAWAIEQIRETEHAVSASIFLEPLRQQGLINEHVTSFLLRDVMGRDEQIKTFQSTDFVAHLERFQGYRKTQEEHIEDILLSVTNPVTCDEVCALYPEYLTHSRASVYGTLSQADYSLNLGQGRFIHREQVGLTNVAQNRLLQAAVNHLQDIEHPLSASTLLDGLEMSPAVAFLRAHPYGGSILWALLKTHPDVVCGKGEIIVLKDEHTDVQDPLLQAIMHIIEQEVVLTPAQIRKEIIFRYGYLANHGPIYNAIDQVVAAGEVRSFIKHWRVLQGADQEQIFEAFVHGSNPQTCPTRWEDLSDDELQELEALLRWTDSKASKRLLEQLDQFVASSRTST